MLGQKRRLFKPYTAISLEELVTLYNFYRKVEANLVAPDTKPQYSINSPYH